jgi:hypothetical protein
MKSFQLRKESYAKFIIAFITLSAILLVIPIISAAAASITLNPSNQAALASVSVTGTNFGATKAVGIGLGQEVVVTGEAHSLSSPTGTGPFTVLVNHYPIKPGSFSFHCVVSSDTNVVESDYTDNGDGTLASSSTYSVSPFVNYVTGAFGRSSTSDWSGYTVVFTASYTYYQYTVTPATGTTTDAAGGFAASITVPNVASGTYSVTALDTQGNKAVTSLTVSTAVPEVFSPVLVVLLSVATVAGAYYLGKKQKPRITVK